MLIGSFKYSIDKKGRIAIPAKLRKSVSPEANETFIITRGTAKCIDIYPLDVWKELTEKTLSQLSPINKKESMFVRFLINQAAEDTLDSQSRLLIPKSLLEYAEIDNEVFILGAIKKIEVWNPKIYEEHMKENEQLFEQIANEVMNDTK